MTFDPLPLAGAFVITIDRLEDERGWFGRTFSASDFASRGLEPAVAECSTSVSERAGTLRGLHYQTSPHGEAKLVRCTRGSAFDVIVDLRTDSPTRCRWFALELRAAAGQLLYVPPGFAHGFQTLEPQTELQYQMSHPYTPSHAAGVRWDDVAFGIRWPPADRVMSERDRSFPDFVL